MDMDFSIDIFVYALEKNTENELFEMWKLQFPNMDKESYISFDDYKKKVISNRRNTNISYEEIEIEMAKVEKAFAEGR
jgi:hypothetical protein